MESINCTLRWDSDFHSSVSLWEWPAERSQPSLWFLHFLVFLTVQVGACLPHVMHVSKLTEHLLFANGFGRPWGHWQVKYTLLRNWQAGTTCDHLPLALASSVMFCTEQAFHEGWLRTHTQQQSTRGATDEALSKEHRGGSPQVGRAGPSWETERLPWRVGAHAGSRKGGGMEWDPFRCKKLSVKWEGRAVQRYLKQHRESENMALSKKMASKWLAELELEDVLKAKDDSAFSTVRNQVLYQALHFTVETAWGEGWGRSGIDQQCSYSPVNVCPLLPLSWLSH